jgi:hypothetical protein
MPRILDTLPQLRAAAGRARIPPALVLRLRGIHPAWWVAAVLMAVVLAQSWIIARKPDVPVIVAEDARERGGEPIASDRAVDTQMREAREIRPGRAEPVAAAAGAAATLAVSGPRAVPRNRLLAFEDLRSARRPIATIAGPIDVVTRTGPPRSTLVAVNGRTLDESSAPFNVLMHRSVYADREVIVGFSDCASGTAACERKEPFWLLLRKSQAPQFKRSAGLRANKSAGAVTALPSGVHVDLGVWDGVRQTATLTSLDDIYVTRVNEAPAPLSGADCRTVAAALESCAASRDCGSYETITQSLPPARMAQIRRLFHESTGLNAPMFRSVCVRSCELGLTPTSALVRREVCGGAAPGQWAQVSLGD